MNSLQEQILAKAKISSVLGRILSMFIMVIDLMPFGIAFAAISDVSAGKMAFMVALPTLIFSGILFAAQIFLARQGLSFSKLILGRQIVNRKTLEPSHWLLVFIRPPISYAWAHICIFGFMAMTLLRGIGAQMTYENAGRSTIKKAVQAEIAHELNKERLHQETAEASYEFFSDPLKVFFYDRLFGSIVISAPRNLLWKSLFKNGDRATADITVASIPQSEESTNKAA